MAAKECERIHAPANKGSAVVIEVGVVIDFEKALRRGPSMFRWIDMWDVFLTQF